MLNVQWQIVHACSKRKQINNQLYFGLKLEGGVCGAVPGNLGYILSDRDNNFALQQITSRTSDEMLQGFLTYKEPDTLFTLGIGV